MAAIVFQKDKRSGITYAYESVSHWDKEKNQSRAKRTLIGRVNPETGEITPTDGRNKKKALLPEPAPKRGPVVAERSARSFYGATYLLDAIAEKLGIERDLKQVFPESYKQILSIAYYLVIEDCSPLFRFERWSDIHKHPYGKNITSQRSSEIFASITDDERNHFFKLQGRRRLDKEYWAYDTTSISSYSETLSQVQRGHNKEDDHLPQLNLALVFGEESNIPFYYRKLAGNIPDSKTVNNLLADLNVLGFSKVKLVMDRGFYSATNINSLFKDNLKFLIAVKMSLSFVKKALDGCYDAFRDYEHFNDKHELYFRTVRTTWDYEQERPKKGDTLNADRRIYIHFFYNIDRAAEDEKAFDRKLMSLRHELEEGKRVPDHEAQYAKYFEVHTTPKRGTHISVNQEAVKHVKCRCALPLAGRAADFFYVAWRKESPGMAA